MHASQSVTGGVHLVLCSGNALRMQVRVSWLARLEFAKFTGCYNTTLRPDAQDRSCDH